MRIMAMGDSNTYGIIDSTNRESGGFRIKLDAKLAAAGIDADFVGSMSSGPSPTGDNQHEGYNGQTIDWLTLKARQVVPLHKPDIILLMAGNNDLVTDSTATMKIEMAKLLDTLAKDAPNATILVATLPPPQPNNTAGQNPVIAAEFNAALPALVASKAAAGMKVKLVDTRSLTTDDMSPVGLDKGTHLNAQGYEKMANFWLEAIKQVVNGSPSAPTGNPVVAVDDMYKIDAGKDLWVNAKYLLMNDTGADGGLKIAAVAAKSQYGFTVDFDSATGNVHYDPGSTWTGIDRIDYTLKDADSSTDTGSIIVTVGAGVSAAAPPLPPSGSGGTGNPVVAVDDAYKVATGQDLWVGTKYLLMNDKGADGGLKITDVAAKSQHGFNVSFDSAKGIVHYDVASGWNGTDRIDYTLKDKDGSTDTGSIVVTVGTGESTAPLSSSGGTGGSGNSVVAVDDTTYKPTVGKAFYFNTKYLTWNDKGLDGGLKVIALDKVSAKGVKVSWDANGTAIYKATSKGTDTLNYTVADADGSTDVGQIIFSVI